MTRTDFIVAAAKAIGLPEIEVAAAVLNEDLMVWWQEMKPASVLPEKHRDFYGDFPAGGFRPTPIRGILSDVIVHSMRKCDSRLQIVDEYGRLYLDTPINHKATFRWSAAPEGEIHGQPWIYVSHPARITVTMREME